MLVNAVQQLTPCRRDRLYCEIQRIVGEVAAVDRSLEGVGEGLVVDEALEEIAILMDEELQRVHHRALSPA